MRKRIALVLGTTLLLATAACHFHGRGHAYGHAVPPGHAKKVVTPVKVQVVAPAPRR